MDIIDAILEAMGGLDGACYTFGWQGGTIHDAKRELIRRLNLNGLKVVYEGSKAVRLENV